MISRVKSSRRASAVAVALLIVLVAAAAWVGVVSPKRSHVSQLKSDVVAAQAQLATATQAAAVANKATEAAALRAMPGDADQPGILDQLNALGKRTGVMVASVSPNLTTTSTNALPMSITVDGKYFQISNFLNKLRTQVSVGKGGHVVADRSLVRRPVGQHRAGQCDRAARSARSPLNASVYGSRSGGPRRRRPPRLRTHQPDGGRNRSASPAPERGEEDRRKVEARQADPRRRRCLARPCSRVRNPEADERQQQLAPARPRRRPATAVPPTAAATGAPSPEVIRADLRQIAKLPPKDPFQAQLGADTAVSTTTQPFTHGPRVRASHFVGKDPFKAQIGGAGERRPGCSARDAAARCRRPRRRTSRRPARLLRRATS